MPRPTKCRRVCNLPQNRSFHCGEGAKEKQPLLMTVEEYETIRLIDGEGLTQEECAERMEVARTTAQRIYLSARQKLAKFLLEGGTLEISGGSYIVCGRPGCAGHRSCSCCRDRRKNRDAAHENPPETR